MNIAKKSDLLFYKDHTMLPVMPMPILTIPREHRGAIERKESDFIKRLKKTKSIMLAQKNRKQKNVLSQYLCDNRKKKCNEYEARSQHNSILLSPPRNENKISLNRDLFEKYLFPPVHSLSLGKKGFYPCKKNNISNMKQLARQTILGESIDILSYLEEQAEAKKKTITLKKQIQFENELVESERLNLNNTEVHTKSVRMYFRSEKKLSQLEERLKNRIKIRFYHPTEPSLEREVERIRGWDVTNNEEQQEQLDKQSEF